MNEYSHFFIIVYKDGTVSKEEFISTQSKKEHDVFIKRLRELEYDDNVLKFTCFQGSELIFYPRKQCRF